MLQLKLTSNKWFRYADVAVRGYAYNEENVCMEGETLAAYFCVHSEQEWNRRLQNCNGLFSVVSYAPDWQAAAVDPSRIYPLYYRLTEEGLLLSDSPYTLLQTNDKLDSVAVAEYGAMAVPMAGKTLVQGLLQVRPGYYLLADGRQCAFWQYTVRQTELHYPSDEEFNGMLQEVFCRLIKSVRGRQLVIPLSGGNDSRLILCMLHSLGYTNVLCYTIGRPGNWESNIACKVATALGYSICQIDTTTPEARSSIAPANGSGERSFEHYYRFIGNLSNFVWLFEYPAILQLQSMGKLSPDAVFVPGHTADVFAGSHLRKGCVSDKSSVRYMTSALIYDSCEYEGKNIQTYVKQYLWQQIQSGYTHTSAYQSFIVQNRLPNNINNSARVYEFFGYDVRLPFWDQKFVEMFRRMPYSALKNCSLYTHFVRTQVFSPLGVDYPQKAYPSSFFFLQKLKKRFKKLLPSSWVHAKAHLTDIIGEHELMQPLLRELVQNGVYQDDKHYYSNNQVIRDWYLMKVKQELHNL